MAERAAELAAMATSADAIEPLPEATQHRVIHWLADTFGVELVAAATAPAAEPSSSGGGTRSATRRKRGTKSGATAASGAAKAARPKVTAPGHDKTLDLYPSGKTSFEDFVTEKSPHDRQQEHNVLAVYWLLQIAEIDAVGPDQVFTCYRKVSWKLPPDLRNSLQKTAYEKGWLDTQEMNDIKITPPGLNFVERDLPRPKKK
jgi:hypothetical protein